MTTLTDRRTQESPDLERLHARIRNLTITVIVLAIALLGLGAWMVYDYTTGSDTAVTGDIESLVDDYNAAWNNYDADAFLALVTDNYTFEGPAGTFSAEDQATGLTALRFYDWNVEMTGDRIMVGDGPSYFVVQPNQVTSTVDDYDGISVFTIVNQDGVYLISHHMFMGNRG